MQGRQEGLDFSKDLEVHLGVVSSLPLIGEGVGLQISLAAPPPTALGTFQRQMEHPLSIPT
jgi:hypothetical protein